jgi:hypothetical protein
VLAIEHLPRNPAHTVQRTEQHAVVGTLTDTAVLNSAPKRKHVRWRPKSDVIAHLDHPVISSTTQQELDRCCNGR